MNINNLGPQSMTLAQAAAAPPLILDPISFIDKPPFLAAQYGLANTATTGVETHCNCELRVVWGILLPVQPIVGQCSPYLRSLPLAAGTCELPHYRFCGPAGGGDPVRIGLFAAIHGDEPAGAQALSHFIEMLCREPEL